MARLPYAWGTTAAEAQGYYPADDLLPGPTVPMTRAVTVEAPVELAWRWLCQIAVAPYSYDWLDNRGRRSPRELTPGADRLEVGQLMMIFELLSFEDGHHWTGVTTPRREPDLRQGRGDLRRRAAGRPALPHGLPPGDADERRALQGSRPRARLGRPGDDAQGAR